MKHANGDYCGACYAKLESCHPELKYWYTRIREVFPTCHIAHGYRNEAEQEKCVKEGASRLSYPKSKHNVCFDGQPQSIAMDLFSQDDEGKGSWRLGFFVQIANWLDDEKAPIQWGGSFKKFPDPPHFELKNVVTAQHL